MTINHIIHSAVTRLQSEKWVRTALPFLLFFAIAARGEINAPGPAAPPQAVPTEVRVRCGGAVEIPLRVFGSGVRVIKYKLRTSPEFGKFTEPNIADENVGVVTYRHSGDVERTRDHFSYVVQTANGVSVPAEVTITIFDDPPILAVPDLIDFGNVLVGETLLRELTIENRGGGVVEGRVQPPEGWAIDGVKTYRMLRGEKATFRVVFSPGSEQQFRADLRYSSHSDRVTMLRAQADMPVAVEPRALELRAPKGGSERSGALQIFNRTSEPLTFHFSTVSELIKVPGEVAVPARGDVSVAVNAAPESTDFITDEIAISSSLFNGKVPVHADGVGPIVRVTPRRLSMKEAGTITVENVGGARASIRTEVATPFEIARGDAKFAIDPREKRDVHVSIRTHGEGTFRGSLVVRSDENDWSVPIDATVTVERPSVPVAHVALAVAAPTPEAASVAPSEEGVTVLKGEKVQLKNVTRTGATLEWKAPTAIPLDWRVEIQQLSLDSNGELQINWIPLEHAVVKQSENTVKAEVRRLTPGHICVLRIVTSTPAGEPRIESPRIEFWTRPPIRLRITPLRVLIVLLLVLMGLIARQRFFPGKPKPPKSAGAASVSSSGKMPSHHKPM